MRKLTILLTLLTLSVGLWAETINDVMYLDAAGVEQTANNVNVVTSSSEVVTWGAVGQETWYVVLSESPARFDKGVICKGNVHLILADYSHLLATGIYPAPGVEVSGEGNSLNIYAQSTSHLEMGKLEATGGTDRDNGGAGIGGGDSMSGSNITINGGDVQATGGYAAAGIGGGSGGTGFNITINGGEVTANGGTGGTGIGGSSGSNKIKVATKLLVKVKGEEGDPESVIVHFSEDDIASKLYQKRFVTIEPDGLYDTKVAAMNEINSAATGTCENIQAIATIAASAVFGGSDATSIDVVKTFAIAAITSAKAAYADGETAGKAEALGPLGTEHPGPAVKVTKGDTEVILYLPDKVEYIIKK